MKWVVCLISLISLITFIGCESKIPTSKGGYISVTDYLNSQKNPDTSDVKTDILVQQPDNPNDSAGLKLTKKPDGTVEVETSTGDSQDVADVPTQVAKVKLLYVPIILASLLIIGGVLSFVWLNKKVGIGLAAGGILLLVLLYTLSQYAIIYLIFGIVIVFGAAGFLLWNKLSENKKLFNGNVENVSLVETIKDVLTDEQRKKIFGDRNTIGTARAIQSQDTINLVKEIKEKHV